MKAYSDTTNTAYDSWDDLVAAEANGYTMTAIISNGKKTWPYVHGPFATQEDARKEARRMRRKFQRDQRGGRYVHQTYQFFIRPLWKPDRG
jgi:hypothetical protein